MPTQKKTLAQVEFPVPVADPERGSGGSLEPPFEAKLFHFHGDLFEKLGKTNKTNPPL